LKNHNKMILFPQPHFWTFWDFIAEAGESPIQEWLDGLSLAAQLTFNSILKQAHKTKSPLEWTGFKRFLAGKKFQKERLWELYFKADGKQYRVVGKFGDNTKQAILLCGCYHKGDVYSPAEALNTAYKRARALAQGKGKLSVREIRIDI